MTEVLKVFLPVQFAQDHQGRVMEILIGSLTEPAVFWEVVGPAPLSMRGGALHGCTCRAKLSPDQMAPGRCRFVVRVRSPGSTDKSELLRDIQFTYEGGEIVLAITYLPGPGFFVERQFVPVEVQPHRFLVAVGGKGADRAGDILKEFARDGMREFPSILRGPPGEDSTHEKSPSDARLFVVGLAEGRSVDDSDGLIQRITRQLTERGLRATPAVITRLQGPLVQGITNELVVRFQQSVPQRLVAEIAKEHGLDVASSVGRTRDCYVLRSPGAPSYRLLDTALRLLEDGRVEEVEPSLVQQAHLDYTPNDPFWPKQDCLQLIGCEAAWDDLAGASASLRGGSAGVTVAVLDADGVDANHPEFSGTVSDGRPKLVAAYDFQAMAPQASSSPGGDHGTACAGAACAAFDNNEGGSGVAPNCRLIGARLPAVFGAKDVADVFLWAAGVDPGRADFPALPSPAADVLSLSCWGASLSAVPLALRAAVDDVTRNGRAGKGCVVVASTGNLGHVPFASSRPLAARSDVVAVGASTRLRPTSPVDSFHADPGRNNRGIAVAPETRALYSPYGREMDLVAPSSTCCKLTSNKDYDDPVLSAVQVGTGSIDGSAGKVGHMHYAQTFGGTSHAAPAVAGAAALVLSADPELTRSEVVDLLRETAEEIDFSNADPVGQWQDLDGDGIKEFSRWYGHGRVDVHKAVQAAARRAKERTADQSLLSSGL